MADFTIAIAGFPIAVCSLFDSTKDYCKDYLTEQAPSYTVTVTEADLRAEQEYLNEEADREGLRRRTFADPFLERNFLQRKVAALLLPEGVLLLHGSAVALDGKGYLFTAPCGTGKSTHARLWRETLGAVAVNDDKPFLRITDRGVLLCGSPWQGKHGLGANITVPLGGIGILARDTVNAAVPLSPQAAAELLLPHCCGAEAKHVAALTRIVPVWQLRCTPQPEAAQVAWSAMTQKV